MLQRILFSVLKIHVYAEADPDFQVRRGGGAFKKIAPSGGRREKFWCISCEKSRLYAKKIIFFSNLGGGAPPPWTRLLYTYTLLTIESDAG